MACLRYNTSRPGISWLPSKTASFTAPSLRSVGEPADAQLKARHHAPAGFTKSRFESRSFIPGPRHCPRLGHPIGSHVASTNDCSTRQVVGLFPVMSAAGNIPVSMRRHVSQDQVAEAEGRIPSCASPRMIPVALIYIYRLWQGANPRLASPLAPRFATPPRVQQKLSPDGRRQ